MNVAKQNIPQSTINYKYSEVIELANADIAGIVGEHVKLTRRGTRFYGVCNLHADKDPSLVVDINKRKFRCYGCGSSGDAVDYIQKVNGFDFKQAISLLADRYGIDLADGKVLSLEARRKAQEARENRLLELTFRAWIERAYKRLAFIYQTTDQALLKTSLWEDLAPLIHLMPMLENYMNVLQYGTNEDKVKLYRSRNLEVYGV